ncbi:MAG: multiheme c-type cytochrome [Planctomycetota bacterium]|nr:multiheme c-type cytochrome [Planctomycetota bacterium]MDA1250977.1 multiheme c-type cytochrome [Planctomycetota bacterium]
MAVRIKTQRSPDAGRIAVRVSLSGLAALALSISASGPQTAVAQDAEPFEYVGYQGCALCHSNEPNPDAGGRLKLDRSFSAMNEGRIFEHDKHIVAFELLSKPLGQKMQAILQTTKRGVNYKVTEAQECLACHSGWKKGEKKPAVYEYGVTCESCHGAASQWEDHHKRDSWRLVSPAEKEEKYNFVDVRNPLRRAEQCFSCHIGNVTEGKVVTHEMYAAGHPPLPGIEIESFIADMPAHWRVLREKGQFLHFQKYLETNFPGMDYDPLQDLPRTKAVMVGGVMALHESIELLSEQSAEPVWPELAVFDCTACHHDLRSPGWRQTRGYSGLIPGRPGTFEWPNALIKLAINHRAGGDADKFASEWAAFAEKKAELTAALNAQPFGSSKQLQAAAASILPWLKSLANDVAMSAVHESQAGHAIKQLLSLGPQDYPDYHSARQVLWAYRTIRSEMTTAYPTLKAPPPEETLKEAQNRGDQNLQSFLVWQNGPQKQGRQKVEDLLKKLELSETMRLNLPSTVDRQITESLPENLDAIGAYDPDWFREKLQMLDAESK